MFSKNILAIFGCLVAGTFAAPAEVPPEKLQPTVIPIVAQSDELEANGTYKFSYETGNGIIREETAYEKVIPRARDAGSSEGGEDDDGDSNEIHVQRGSYSYTAPDGTVISVSYIADENGFQPIGDHLPRSPVVFPVSNIAEKSGRALKIADSSESAATPTAAKVIDKPIESAEAKTKPEVTPIETPEEENSVSVNEAKPESATISEVEDTKPKSVPASSTKENKLVASVSTPATKQNDPTSGPITVTQETKSEADASTTEQAVGARSAEIETGLSTTETISTIAEASTTEASEATSVDVDVSTEAASTAASVQSTTESEQATTISADQASTSAPESTASSKVSEQSSSTSAPESTSFGELDGSSTSTEAVNQTFTEQTGQPSTKAPELASTEQSRSTATA